MILIYTYIFNHINYINIPLYIYTHPKLIFHIDIKWYSYTIYSLKISGAFRRQGGPSGLGATGGVRAFLAAFWPKKPRFAKEKTSKNIKKHGEHHVLATKMRVLNGLTGKNEFVSPRYFARVGHNPVKSAYSAKVLGPVLG